MKASRPSLPRGWKSVSRLGYEEEADAIDKLCVSPTGFLAHACCVRENVVCVRTPQGKMIDASCRTGGLPGGASLSFTGL
eukprot:770291-Prymnesium_polylepis.1